MKRFRRCPFSGWPCFKKLPDGVREMHVHTNIAVCSTNCATLYAKGKGDILIGEHRVTGLNGSSVCYSIGSPQHGAEKSKK